MKHKTDYMYETIIPGLVCEALNYLIHTPLYKKYGVTASSTYLKRYENFENEINFIVDISVEASLLDDQDNC